jgi:hypothetical protein
VNEHQVVGQFFYATRPQAAILPQAESLVPGSPVKLDILRILLEVRLITRVCTGQMGTDNTLSR